VINITWADLHKLVKLKGGAFGKVAYVARYRTSTQYAVRVKVCSRVRLFDFDNSEFTCTAAGEYLKDPNRLTDCMLCNHLNVAQILPNVLFKLY
jgi:hypothetical protein